MTIPAISFAAGITPEATPAQLVECAAQAKFDYGGMWVEKDSWTPATTRSIRKHLSDADVRLLDLEVLWIMPGPPDPWLDEMVDIAAELGAANVLCVSSDPDPSATAAKLQRLVERAQGTGVCVNLEFALFTEVKSLDAAISIFEQIDGGSKGILFDTLHWSRTGSSTDDIASVPAEWISYAQLCDAPAQAPDLTNPDAIIDDAINQRCPLGQGGLDVAGMKDALPNGIAFAIEERSQALRDAFPDPIDRAKQVAKTTRAWLEERHKPSA
ncbi:MAG: TIM barrel protein [Erythrobacter sp.]